MLEAIIMRTPVEALPVQIRITLQQYKSIAKQNPHAALAILRIMNEGKEEDTPLVGVTFSSPTVSESIALDAWAARLVNSPPLEHPSLRNEFVQTVFSRKLDVDGKLLISFEIVSRAEDLTEIGRSYFQLKLSPAYTVHPARPVYDIYSWRLGVSQSERNEN